MSEKSNIRYYIQKGTPIVQNITKNTVNKFPLFAILTIIFVIAKIFDKLDWNWFMVFWPMWIVPAIILSIMLVFGAFFLLAVCWFMALGVWDWYKLRKKIKRG
jgi:hypothetical protein